MWYRIEFGYTEKQPVEHHVGRSCFTEADNLESAKTKAMQYFKVHPLKDLKINEIYEVDYTPTHGFIE